MEIICYGIIGRGKRVIGARRDAEAEAETCGLALNRTVTIIEARAWEEENAG